MTENINDWERRCVDFSQAHGNLNGSLESLVRDLNPKSGDKIVDLMCGYGEVSKYLLNYCANNAIDINLFLSDFSETQLKKSREFLEEFKNSGKIISRRNEDILSLRLPSDYFDYAIMSMGLHELPKEKQVLALKNVKKILKPGSKIYVLESYGDEEINQYFKAIVRKKDELAGFENLAKNRYFSTGQELTDNMEDAGFQYVTPIYHGPFSYDTENFLVSDFQKDVSRLTEWNDYIREIIPEKDREKVCYLDKGSSIKLSFTKAVFSGTKPC